MAAKPAINWYKVDFFNEFILFKDKIYSSQFIDFGPYSKKTRNLDYNSTKRFNNVSKVLQLYYLHVY